jgi:putative FmdB family regulatory protein
MPIYEYTCANCNGRFQMLTQGFSTPEGLACPRCSSTNVRKAVSRVAFMQSEEARLEALADPSSLSGLDEDDPASVARWAKKMGKAMGDELGNDWEEMVDEMLEEEMQGGQTGTGDKEDNLGWA